MDLATLISLYPIAQTLIKNASKIKDWMEDKAKKEDPLFLLQLQSLEALSSLNNRFDDLRRYTLLTSIMGAMLSKPDLEAKVIKQKFMESGEVANDIISTLEKISP